MTSENSSTRVQAPAHIPEYSSSQSQSSETHDGVVLNPSGRINLDGEDLCSHGATSSRVVEDILDVHVGVVEGELDLIHCWSTRDLDLIHHWSLNCCTI